MRQFKRLNGNADWPWEIITIYSDGRVESTWSRTEPNLPEWTENSRAETMYAAS